MHANTSPRLMAVCNPYFIPKCAINLWLALENGLLTRDRMISSGMTTDRGCLLCNTEVNNVIFSLLARLHASKNFDVSPLPLNANWDDFTVRRLLRSDSRKLM